MGVSSSTGGVMTKGVVYVLSNEAIDGYIKIGKTTNLEQRLMCLQDRTRLCLRSGSKID